MNRPQLEHIIRAASANADTREIVIIGSQAILGAFPDAPDELLASMEADVFPKDRPADSILIDGAIGERSVFHETFGYYAHGVDETTAILPGGWCERLVRIENENTRGAIGWCLDPHDLAFVAALLRHALVRIGTVRGRLALTPLDDARRQFCDARLHRLSS